MEHNGVVAGYDDLRRISMVVTGVVAIIILGFALLFPSRNRGSSVTDIAKAIQADEFIPYYQPVVDIQTGRLLGAEVLVRWRRSDGTMVEPGSFIPLMETSGLVIDLTRSLMRIVRKEMVEAIGSRPEMSLAFNVAPPHFNEALILNDVGAIFEGSSIKLSQLVLELTERYEVENLTATRRVVAALQGLGVKVAIDDVGTGHSGLSYILKLGVDIIKIDKIFVEAIGTERHSKAIIEMHDRSGAQHAHGDHRRGCRDLRPGELPARPWHPLGPGLRLRAGRCRAAFLQLVEAMDPLSGSAGADARIAEMKPAAKSAA